MALTELTIPDLIAGNIDNSVPHYVLNTVLINRFIRTGPLHEVMNLLRNLCLMHTDMLYVGGTDGGREAYYQLDIDNIMTICCNLSIFRGSIYKSTMIMVYVTRTDSGIYRLGYF